MVVNENPAKYQCALTKSSRMHYINAIEAHQEGRNIHGHLTAATETAEASGDMELYGWLGSFAANFESTGNPDMSLATSIVTRYNEYNQICGWGLDDFNPGEPWGLPGGDVIID